MFNVNCEIDQHDKLYLPANVQQNRTTSVGVMAPEMSVFTYSCIFGYYLEFIEDRRSILIANLNSMTRSISLESDYRCWSYSL